MWYTKNGDKMNKIILVDGNNLLFRSYFATSYSGVIMRNSKGFPTNALYGFINMMNKIISEENPNYIMVAFDRGKTFRHDKYDSYKAGRKEMPDELKQQFPVAKELLDAMGIFHFEIDNYEADDIIGTVSKKIEEEADFLGTIISSDKDLLQLISEKIDVKLLKTSGHIRMNKNTFFEIYGLEPIKMIDLKSLMGDASDHIPGVKGIGEKTAINLLKEYNSLDNIYQNIDNISGKMKEKLINDKENAYMSYDLATIYREVPITFSFNELAYRGFNKEKYIEILKELEFNSLLKKVEELPDKLENKIEIPNIIEVDDLEKVKLNGNYSIYFELEQGNYHNEEPKSITLYDGKNCYYFTMDVARKRPLFFDCDKEKYTYDLKRLFVSFKNSNIKISNITFDAMIAGYLLNYDVKDDLAYLENDMKSGYDFPIYEELFGTEKRPKKVDKSERIKLCALKAKFIYESKSRLLEKLKNEDQLALFLDIEMPLAFVLADMELTGILVDKLYLEQMEVELKEKMNNLAKEIYINANCEFNIMSPKQLGDILFNKLAIPYPKRIKDQNYSTSKEILDKIINLHPIVGQILEYRTIAKLYTNYAVGLLQEIKDDGRIHTIYNQTLTRTGRLSSVSPNLQNIPARLEYGRLIRKAFVAGENCVLVSSDYSQIELRMFAHMSKADNLINAFKENKDIHTKTASDIFNVLEEDVTAAMRRTAKAVNFGILYGISSFGLSEDLKIDVKSAKEFIDTYLNTYPGIKEYMNKEIEDAYKDGYVKTIMNRKRRIDELNSKTYMVKSQGERMALNTPIQGSSADILKKAMVDIFKELSNRNLKSKMLLQVHDELVFEVLKDEVDVVVELVKNIMENTYPLSVPLRVEIALGNNWYEAK